MQHQWVGQEDLVLRDPKGGKSALINGGFILSSHVMLCQLYSMSATFWGGESHNPRRAHGPGAVFRNTFENAICHTGWVLRILVTHACTEKSQYEKLNRDHAQLRLQGNKVETVSEV